MPKSQVHFEAVQVTSRTADGRLQEWYAGEKRATENEAKDDAKSFARSFPGTSYQVIRVSIDEIGMPFIKKSTAAR
jgi:hypothetical protein